MRSEGARFVNGPAELRDGRRPRRTGAEDSAIDDHGPRIEWLQGLSGSSWNISHGDRARMLARGNGASFNAPDYEILSVSIEPPHIEQRLMVPRNGSGLLECSGDLCVR